MKKLRPEHIAWTRSTFGLVAVGGVWVIPRSGIMIRKLDPTRGCCFMCMPHDASMPCSADELRAIQDKDLEQIIAHAAAAGITIEDQRNHSLH